MSENMQQAAEKKMLSSAAAINADWKKDQNSMNENMIKKWVSEKSSDIQNTAQHMKTAMKNRETWMKAARNQKIRMCCDQITCNFLQDRKDSNYSNKNKQNWAYSILESNISIRCRIFCLSMQMSKRNCSTHNNILFLLHWDKISDSRFTHESSKYQKSH